MTHPCVLCCAQPTRVSITKVCLLSMDGYLYGRRENQVSHWVDFCKWGFGKVCDMFLSTILSGLREAHI